MHLQKKIVVFVVPQTTLKPKVKGLSNVECMTGIEIFYRVRACCEEKGWEMSQKTGLNWAVSIEWGFFSCRAYYWGIEWLVEIRSKNLDSSNWGCMWRQVQSNVLVRVGWVARLMTKWNISGREGECWMVYGVGLLVVLMGGGLRVEIVVEGG